MAKKNNKVIQEARNKVIIAWIDYVATLEEHEYDVDVLEEINDLLSDLGNNEY